MRNVLLVLKSFFSRWFEKSPLSCVGISFLVVALFILSVVGKLDDCIMLLVSLIVGLGSIAVFFLIILLVIAFCCLPIVIAVVRKHSNMMPIILAAIFFSWTGIGWLIALIWAFSDNTKN